MFLHDPCALLCHNVMLSPILMSLLWCLLIDCTCYYDRDTCMASVVGSHDIHVGKLLAREDETRAAETRGMTSVVDG